MRVGYVLDVLYKLFLSFIGLIWHCSALHYAVHHFNSYKLQLPMIKSLGRYVPQDSSLFILYAWLLCATFMMMDLAI